MARDPLEEARRLREQTARKMAASRGEPYVHKSPLGQAVEDSRPVLVVTMNDVPGYDITEVLGDVFGLTVRARNYFSNIGASFRTIAGGEVGGYTKLLSDTRLEARARLIGEARNMGANAVVAMRFDANEIGDIMTEVVAYGTAVIVKRTATRPQGSVHVEPQPGQQPL